MAVPWRMGRIMEARVGAPAPNPVSRVIVMQGSNTTAAAVQKHYTLPAVAAAVIHYLLRAPAFRCRARPPKASKSLPEGFQLTIHD